MRITEVSISYGRTESLPDYCNVKPGITLTAELRDGENIDLMIESLQGSAMAIVHEMIDTALEAADRPAKYSTEPRYTLLVSSPVWVDNLETQGKVKVKPPERIIVIVPSYYPTPRSTWDRQYWLVRANGEDSGLRYDHAHKRAIALAQAETPSTIIDASIDQGGIPAWALEPPAETIDRLQLQGDLQVR